MAFPPCRHGGQLTLSKKIAVVGQSIVGRFEISRIIRQIHVGFPCWIGQECDGFHLWRWRDVNTPPHAFRNGCHKFLPYTASLSFGADVLVVNRNVGHEAAECFALSCCGPSVSLDRWGAEVDRETIAAAFKNGLHPGFFAFLIEQNECGRQRHIHVRKRRIGTLDCPRPDSSSPITGQ